VQAPYNAQSLNRYSYTSNNPTTLTDPSGFDDVRFDNCVFAGAETPGCKTLGCLLNCPYIFTDTPSVGSTFGYSSGDTLILRGTHIAGQGTLREALAAAKAFGREQGAKRVIIEGARRSTGANPGHIPRPIIVETGL